MIGLTIKVAVVVPSVAMIRTSVTFTMIHQRWKRRKTMTNNTKLELKFFFKATAYFILSLWAGLIISRGCM
tara:strand:- start:4380 stop:4592 length:213 start_codon:yes stop_codon:yes gene_type:complete